MITTVLLLQLAVHQPCIRSISDCSKMQWSTKFMARKILTSSTDIQYFECLLGLERLLINILKSKGPESRSQWPRRLYGRDYIGARTDTTQQSGQTLDKEVDIKHITAYVSGYTETDPTGTLSPNNGRLSGTNKVWPHTCCSVHRIRVVLQ